MADKEKIKIIIFEQSLGHKSVGKIPCIETYYSNNFMSSDITRSNFLTLQATALQL